MFRKNIFEFPEFKNILLNILEQVFIFTEYFCVIDNYNKDLKAKLNKQIIIFLLWSYKVKDRVNFFLYIVHIN